MSSPYIPGQWRPTALILANLLGIFLFASWLLEPTRSLWMQLDEWAFWGMNNSLAEGKTWQWIWAISNTRIFDLVPAAGMLLLFYHRGIIKDRENLSRYIAIGLLMLVTLGIASQIGNALPITRPSATLVFPEALRITELVPGVPAKYASGDTFPGDHGLALLYIASFILFFMPRIYGILACVIMVLFTMPRLMVGAHWLTDEIVGALAVGIICLSWVLATPLHSKALDKIESWINRCRAVFSRS
jgi:membrane-associated phospholipid phosphatase